MVLPGGIAHGLAARGHDVHVVTGFPNYPTGHLYPGWRIRPYQRDVLTEGLTVHRAPIYPSHDTGAVGRFANYTSFAASAAATALARVPRPDVWLTYSSPATANLPAMVAGWHGRVPSAMLLQDLWPDSVTDSGMASPRLISSARSTLDRFCSATYRRASRIGVISPGMADLLVDRGVPREKIRYTPNWAAGTDHGLGEAPRPDRRQMGLPDGVLFMYAGNLGRLQALDQLIEAFSGQQNAQLVLIGDGVEGPHLSSLAENLPNIHLVGYVPAPQLPSYQLAADVLVVSLADTPLLRVTMPSKVQSYLATGRPILAHATGDVADLIGRSGGLSVSPGDLGATRDAIRRFTQMDAAERTQRGAQARGVYERQFTQAASIDGIEQLLIESVAVGRG